MKKKETPIIPIEDVQRLIITLRNVNVMLDYDLAYLYGVETKQLKRGVRRNIGRFPPDFMFELTKDEYRALRCQFGTLKRGKHSKYLPMAFTEECVAMLSSVLNSRRAIEVNILIMRAFVRLRGAMASSKELARRLDELEKRIASHDENIRMLFQGVRQLMAPAGGQKKQIGFHVKEKRASYGSR